MKIVPLAADSMGVRSMATAIETAERKLIIDPGASLCPNRDGLEPHPVETFALKRQIERIRLYLETSPIVIFTQFSLEHLLTDPPEIYREKILFMKNPNDLPAAARGEAFQILDRIRPYPEAIYYADSRSFETGGVRLVFSEPILFLDDNPPMRSIAVVVIEDEETFLYASETAGLGNETFKRFLIKHNPTFLYLDGPDPGPWSSEAWLTFQSELEAILDITNIKVILLDHHFCRDLHCERRMTTLSSLANRHGVRLMTAAQYRGQGNELLEARRHNLYQEEGPPLTPAEELP